MKLLFTFLVAFLIQVSSFAGSGIFQSYIILDVNGGGNSYYHGGINSDGGANFFNTRDFMSPTSLTLKGGELKTFKNGVSDVFGAKLNYRVYKSGTTAGTFTEIDLPFAENLPSPGDQRWDETSLNIDLMALATSNGTWVIEIFWRSPSSDGDNFDSDNGNNFMATFMQTLLPVELTRFDLEKKPNQHLLHWTTASEINNSHFEIEHSTDSRTWTTLGHQAGAGFSSESINYEFIHADPKRGMNYYRLKQVDFDGSFEYSEVVSANFEQEQDWQVFPNPVRAALFFNTQDTENENIILNIFNVAGQLVQTQQLENQDGAVGIDVVALKSGMYFLQILDETGNALLQQQFVKK